MIAPRKAGGMARGPPSWWISSIWVVMRRRGKSGKFRLLQAQGAKGSHRRVQENQRPVDQPARQGRLPGGCAAVYGGGNSLRLKYGYSFTGNVVSHSGSTNGGDELYLDGSQPAWL